MEFDKTRLMNNINLLIKEKNLKIGELENEMGVSTGYISRMAKSEKESAPSVDFICKLAAKFEVSMDLLVGGDFEKANDNLKYMERFIHTLIDDTNAHVFDWERFTNMKKLEEEYAFPELNMQTRTLVVNMQEGKHSMQFRSSFKSEAKLIIENENFNAFVPRMGCVMMFKLREFNTEEPVYEMYVVNMEEDKVIPLCSTLENDGVLESVLVELFSCIERHDRDLKISEDARYLIDSYFRYQDEPPF